MPVHPLEERKLPPTTGTRFGASRLGTRPTECGAGHCGVDLYYWQGEADRNVGIGRPVFAVAAGKVISSTRAQSGAGEFIWLQHNGWRSHYVHLDQRLVQTGQQVEEGQQIGTLGRTGIKTDPAHLHFGLSRASGGRYVYYDPAPSLSSWPLVAAAGGGAGLLIAAVALYLYLKR